MTVLVTGGASGIGRAVVDAALAEGWRVAILDLPGPALDAAREGLEPERVRCSAVDVTDEAAVAAEVAAIEAGFGPLAGVVNAAGIARDIPALETGTDIFRRILEVNVIGSFVVAREAARAMRGRGGSIVNIGSVSGLQGNDGRTAYGASKGAVVTMSRVMAVELAPLGIRVNVVAPGPVETPMVREVHTAEARLAWTARLPLGRYALPEEVAAAVVFLLDGRKSASVTGHTLCVDGGFATAGVIRRDPEADGPGAADG